MKTKLTALTLSTAAGALALIVVLALFVVPGCRSGGGCDNGVCYCAAGASCDLGCAAPPCHVTCEGDNPDCNAVCANGTCTCGSESRCNFTCAAPPCHVTCGPHSSCAGTCANGQCVCGADSDCAFTCSSSPCHITCAAGARCLVHCPADLAGTEGCDIVACAAGAPVICPDGRATTCGAPCP